MCTRCVYVWFVRVLEQWYGSQRGSWSLQALRVQAGGSDAVEVSKEQVLLLQCYSNEPDESHPNLHQALAIADLSHLHFDPESEQFERVVQELNAVLACARSTQVLLPVALAVWQLCPSMTRLMCTRRGWASLRALREANPAWTSLLMPATAMAWQRRHCRLTS